MTSRDHGPDETTRRLNELDDELKRAFTVRSGAADLRAAFLERVAAQEAVSKEPAAPRTDMPTRKGAGPAVPNRPPRIPHTSGSGPREHRAVKRAPGQMVLVSFALPVFAVLIYELTKDLETSLLMSLGVAGGLHNLLDRGRSEDRDLK